MKKRKLIVVLLVAIAVILVFIAIVFVHNHSQSTSESKSKSSLIVKKSRKNKNKKATTSSISNKDNYTNAEWMLMGYMSYAHNNYVESRHIKNNAELVKDVGEDLANNALQAEKITKASYRLTNKFGSVDIIVNKNNVKVTGDGDTTITKTKLKNTFGIYASQIQKMTKEITKAKNIPNKVEDLNNQEIAVALFIDGANGSSISEKINSIESVIKKDQTSSIKNFPRDSYLSGLYQGTHKGQFYYSIAQSFSTSAYISYYVENGSDKIAVQPGGANLGMDGPKTYKSKTTIIRKYRSYKEDIDQILQGLEYNKSQMSRISKEMNKEAEKEIEK